MVKFSALVGGGLFAGSVLAVGTPHGVDLKARDVTVTVTVTTCPEAGSTYPTIGSGPVGTPSNSLPSTIPTTIFETSYGYTTAPVTSTIDTGSASAPPTTESSIGSVSTPTVPVPTPSTETNTPIAPPSTELTTSTSAGTTSSTHTSTHTSTTPTASASIPPAVGAANKMSLNAGALALVAFAVLY